MLWAILTKLKMNKKEYIGHLANALVGKKTTMTAKTLANHLNEIGFETSYGTEYAGGHGTYTLIHSTYDWFVSNGNQANADKVAQTFVKPDGTYAYEK
jgi:hypothetical protein